MLSMVDFLPKLTGRPLTIIRNLRVSGWKEIRNRIAILIVIGKKHN